jgi:GT2 family glycosyltransferase
MTGTSAQVDVIILSWNRVDDTIAAIRSAVAQTGIARRILVVDQGSEPENLRALECFLQNNPDVDLRKLGRNVGVAAGRNIATAMGRAPYVVALDSDAEFADQHVLERVVVHLEANPQLCAIGFRITNFFTGENDVTSWDYSGADDPGRRFFTTRFIGAGHALRRNTFESVGGYDERLFFCGEEVDLCYRMLNFSGHRIAYMPDVVIRHKVSPEHRVYWGRGRYYYTVRNNLYTSYKFGFPPPRLALSAAAFFIKGLRNGVFFETLRAFRDCVRMCREFRMSSEDKRPYRLTRKTWAYVLQCEPSRRDGVIRKIHRQFSGLPHQG